MKSAAGSVFALVLAGFLVWFVWTWGFCRFYVGPERMAVITAKSGAALPPGQILARKGQKGIQADVLGEGRHFLNPIMFERRILPVVTIPAGKVGIVTSKVGENLPEGEFLAERAQKGIWRTVLGPGKYRLNPFGCKIDVADAISIPIGYVGVMTSLSGGQARNGEFAAGDQKGVRSDVLPPGLYYVNPKAVKVDVVEVGVNQVSMTGRTGGEVLTKGQLDTKNAAMEQLQRNVIEEQKKKRWNYLSESLGSEMRRRQAANVQSAPQPQQAQQATAQKPLDLEQARQQYLQGESMTPVAMTEFVEFPSRDGFRISLDLTVEFELLPGDIAWVFSRYGDLPAVVDKIIVPQITSISRNKGSEYGARDFIVGEGREKFQTELTRALANTLKEKKIIVHNALIRHVDVPAQILEPIQQAAIAVEENLTNIEKQNTAKKQAELNTGQSLIEQRREQVAQETEKIKAETAADQEKQVAEIRAGMLKKVAEVAKQTAGIRAEKVRVIAVADAEALRMVEGERAKGLQMKAGAAGDPAAYSLWEFAQRLNPDVSVNIIHTGPGTLWTDLEKARAGDLGGALMLQKAGAGEQPK